MKYPKHKFTNPFRYTPSAAIQNAAANVISHIEADINLKNAFREGKMLGVLIARDSNGTLHSLAGFSGNIDGKNMIPGFVPPIFDLLAPNGYFKINEAKITAINREIKNISSSQELHQLKIEKETLECEAETAIAQFKSKMDAAKEERQRLRNESALSQEEANRLTKESQFMKAELRRIKKSFETHIKEKDESIAAFQSKILSLKQKRQEMSEDLQAWLFKKYIVKNSLGEEKSVLNIFAEKGLTPPAGTGECAAPKLLQYAYSNGMEPVEMGEFWYGASPEKEIRVSGHFYPSCQNKCGPLLGFMLQGLEIEGNDDTLNPDSCADIVIYHDNSIIVCNKPSGMPSVPGKNGITSLQERLETEFGNIFTVHRLDMDTSGLIIFARDSKSQKILQQQFASRFVTKTYTARLCPGDTVLRPKGEKLYKGMKGRISLPLIADINDRPRQMVDFDNGKEAITDFEITDVTPYGIDIIFHPITGRTHQLRVHSAHPQGLNSPILGDKLYGGYSKGSNKTDKNCTTQENSCLALKATELVFRHPESNQTIRFCLNQ